MLQRKYIILTSLTMCMVAGCGTTAQNNNDTDVHIIEENEHYREIINVAITADPPTLDTVITSSNITKDIGMHVYEALFTMNEEFKPVPMLAESYEVNEDFTEFSFTLRDNVTFHNNKKMTAEDVVDSMNYWLENSERAQAILPDGKFTVTDKLTLTATFEDSALDLITLMSSRTEMPAIRPSEVYNDINDEVAEYIGTGPYKLQEWNHDQYISLEKYDNYISRDENPDGYSGKKTVPTPYIKYHIVTDESTQLAGLLTGEYDIGGVSSDNLDQIKKEESLSVETGRGGGTLVATFNVNNGIFSNKKARQAVLASLDLDNIMLNAYGDEDLYEIAPGYMDPKSTYWGKQPDVDFYNKHDIEYGQELLAEANYNNETVRLLTTPDYQEMYNATITMEDQLKQLGMETSVDQYDFPTFMENRAQESGWDIFITSNAYQVLPGQVLSLNPEWGGAKDDTFLSMIDEMGHATSMDEKIDAWNNLQDYMYNDYVPSIVLGQYKSYVVYNKDIEGMDYIEQPVLWNAKIKEK